MTAHASKSATLPRLSIEDFFDWAETQERRYELVGGVPRVLPWVKLAHNRIVMNLTCLFQRDLDEDLFELATGDFAIQVGRDSIRYPDLSVFPAGQPNDIRSVSNAVLIVEVLSDSKMHIDLHEKLLQYQGLLSLQSYLVIAQDQRHVSHWERIDGRWGTEPTEYRAGAVALRALDLSLPLDGIYRAVI